MKSRVLNSTLGSEVSGNPTLNKYSPQLDQFSLFFSESKRRSNNEERIFTSAQDDETSSRTKQPSVTTFESFSSSILDLPTIITNKDFDSYTANYTKLLDKAADYRKKLAELSIITNEFGDALDDCINKCPKVNNSKIVNDGIINSGGLQYVLSNNSSILSKLIENNFEKPLATEIELLQKNYQNNLNFYQTEIKSKTRQLRLKELENIKLTNQKTKNLHSYKSNLVNLTNQLDEIDRLKYDYYHEINSMIENFNQRHLLIKTGSLVKAQLELLETVARKGWSGGGLDEVLAISPDLFDSIEETEVEIPVSGLTMTDFADESFNLNEADQTLETIKVDYQNNPLILQQPRTLTPETTTDNIEAETSIQHAPDDNLHLPVLDTKNSLLTKQFDVE